MTKFGFVLAIAAGLLGGFASRYLSPEPAHAQVSTPAEIRARKFLLVDEKGHVSGVFGMEQGKHQPVIELFDERGRETWRAGAFAPRVPVGK